MRKRKKIRSSRQTIAPQADRLPCIIIIEFKVGTRRINAYTLHQADFCFVYPQIKNWAVCLIFELFWSIYIKFKNCNKKIFMLIAQASKKYICENKWAATEIFELKNLFRLAI